MKLSDYIYYEEPAGVIYCGDCLEILDLYGPTEIADLTITSPPYNANLRVRGDDYCSANYGTRIKYGEFTDDLPVADYSRQQIEVLQYLIMKTKYHVFYNIQLLTGNKRAIPDILWATYGNLKEILIWDKVNAEPAISDGVFNSRFEFIFVYSKDKPLHREFSNPNFNRGSVEMASDLVNVNKIFNELLDTGMLKKKRGEKVYMNLRLNMSKMP